MNLCNETQRALYSHGGQPYHYHSLLKQEALMKLCAKQAQDRVLLRLDETSIRAPFILNQSDYASEYTPYESAVFKRSRDSEPSKTRSHLTKKGCCHSQR